MTKGKPRQQITLRINPEELEALKLIAEYERENITALAHKTARRIVKKYQQAVNKDYRTYALSRCL